MIVDILLVGESEIWWLDLIQNKWIESNCNLIDEYNKSKVCIINDNDNFIHLMNVKENNNKYHVKVSLYDLLPKEVIKAYRNYHDALVIGYIKENESNFDINIPFTLKKMILKHLPLFK